MRKTRYGRTDEESGTEELGVIWEGLNGETILKKGEREDRVNTRKMRYGRTGKKSGRKDLVLTEVIGAFKFRNLNPVRSRANGQREWTEELEGIWERLNGETILRKRRTGGASKHDFLRMSMSVPCFNGEVERD